MSTTLHVENRLDVLFVSELGLWPMDRGFRVHGCQMAKALDEIGVSVGMASLRSTAEDAPEWLSSLLMPWPTASAEDVETFLAGWDGRLSKLRRRVARHQAIDPYELAGIIGLVREYRPKVVVALGQHGAMMLRGLRSAAPDVTTVWYAADEPVLFHLSCLRRDPQALWKSRLKLASLFATTQNLFARGCDGAIGVSPADTVALRWLAGPRSAATIRNGVDLHRFTPTDTPAQPGSVVFWGRMDFEPNIDAVIWFANHVWPTLAKRSPGARFTIVGKNPVPAVKQLKAVRGVQITGEVEDIRPFAHEAAVTVLPMRCGRGIKNKLLEAAALGRPIVTSPHAIRGLNWNKATPPFATATSAASWIETVWHLWHDPAARGRYQRDARRWVEQDHDWASSALTMIDYCNTLLSEDRRIEPMADGVPLVCRVDQLTNTPHRIAA